MGACAWEPTSMLSCSGALFEERRLSAGTSSAGALGTTIHGLCTYIDHLHHLQLVLWSIYMAILVIHSCAQCPVRRKEGSCDRFLCIPSMLRAALDNHAEEAGEPRRGRMERLLLRKKSILPPSSVDMWTSNLLN